MLKVKTIKLKNGEDFGKRLKECREWKGLTQREIFPNRNQGFISKFENGHRPRIELHNLIDYVKSLGIKKVEFLINKEGDNISINRNNYGYIFGEIRRNKGLSPKNLMGKNTGSQFYDFEKMDYKDKVQITTILKFAKALGIKTLIINLD